MEGGGQTDRSPGRRLSLRKARRRLDEVAARERRVWPAWPVALDSPTTLFDAERQFNRADRSAGPTLGLALSGGGNRSAAFSIGVMCALHEKGLLGRVDVISAVSGGSYALSWFLLQPYYAALASDIDPAALQDEMFDFEGRFQRYLELNAKGGHIGKFDMTFVTAISLTWDILFFNLLRPLSSTLVRFGWPGAADLLNETSSREDYREGIQKTYQLLPDGDGNALNERFTRRQKIDERFRRRSALSAASPPVSFSELSVFARDHSLPAFVFNATVRPPKPWSRAPLAQRVFEIGTIGFGSDSCGYLTWEQADAMSWLEESSAETINEIRNEYYGHRYFPYGLLHNANTASAISGAALSGTNIDRGSIRRTLRVSNLGLEYAFCSPLEQRRQIYLSDGGHSENLGAYALLRRRCRTIVIVDAEHDPDFAFKSYGDLQDAVATELGLTLEVPAIDEGRFSSASPVSHGHVVKNGQTYADLVYIKLSIDRDLLGDQREHVEPYASKHTRFPHERTTDQYFQPEQFRAYRALGYAVGRQVDMSERRSAAL
jgi:hypothetical protein